MPPCKLQDLFLQMSPQLPLSRFLAQKCPFVSMVLMFVSLPHQPTSTIPRCLKIPWQRNKINTQLELLSKYTHTHTPKKINTQNHIILLRCTEFSKSYSTINLSSTLEPSKVSMQILLQNPLIQLSLAVLDLFLVTLKIPPYLLSDNIPLSSFSK